MGLEGLDKRTPRCCYLHFGRTWLPCRRQATVCIQEDRTDIHPADGYTESCDRHVGALLGSVEPDGFGWQWLVWPLDRYDELALPRGV